MGIEKEKFSLHPNKHILPRQLILPIGRRNSLTRGESDLLFHISLQTIKWDTSILQWAICFIQSTNLNVLLFSRSFMSNSWDSEDGSHQAPLPMGFLRRAYWSGLPFPSPGDPLNPGIEPRSPVLQAESLLTEPPGNYPEVPQLQLFDLTMEI